MDELKQYLAKYLLEKGYKQFSENIGLYFCLWSLLICTIVPFVVKIVKQVFKFIKQKKAVRELHPYFLPAEVKAAMNFYINTKCQNISPSDYDELKSSHAFAVQENLMPFFIKKAFKSILDNRFYFILSDSGMGKTTFLINLYVKYSNSFNKQYKIKLLPLGSKAID